MIGPPPRRSVGGVGPVTREKVNTVPETMVYSLTAPPAAGLTTSLPPSALGAIAVALLGLLFLAVFLRQVLFRPVEEAPTDAEARAHRASLPPAHPRLGRPRPRHPARQRSPGAWR